MGASLYWGTRYHTGRCSASYRRWSCEEDSGAVQLWHTEDPEDGMEALTTSATRLAYPGRQAPVSFRCLLDEQPADLLPRSALAELQGLRVARGLVLSPCCQFFSNDLRRLPFVERFYSICDTLWALDPATNGLCPFWLGGNFLRWLGTTRPGEPPSRDMPVQVASVLRFAELLVARDYKARRQQEWVKTIAQQGAFFRERGYVPLRRLLHPFYLASLRHYYRNLINTGAFRPGEGEYSSRLWMHNEVTTRFFHHQLSSVVSDITGEPAQPSYAYVCAYLGGAELPKHTDREQCEFTISLCIDFIPEPPGVTGWPLYLETKNGPVAIQQALGDGLLFLGRELPHYRQPLPLGCTATSVFFHFVRRGFTGKLD